MPHRVTARILGFGSSTWSANARIRASQVLETSSSRINPFNSIRAYVCPSCLLRASRSQSRRPSLSIITPSTALSFGSRSRSLRAGTGPRRSILECPGRQTTRHASVTALRSGASINVRPEMPPQIQPLYVALGRLEHAAKVYVDISQLRLALQSLEYGGEAVTRVAILGVNGAEGARRLARVLLADPLGKEAWWEKELVEPDEGSGRILDNRALLLRYGEGSDVVDDRHPLVKTLKIPAEVLRRRKLEIFVQSVDGVQVGDQGQVNNLLVPSLEAFNAPGGRSGMVTYPVHKSLIYMGGMTDLRPLASCLAADVTAEDGQNTTIRYVVDGGWSSLQPRMGEEGRSLSPINLSLAEVAIDTLRKSVQRSLDYEHAWFDSGLAPLVRWLNQGTTNLSTEPVTITPATRKLIDVIVDDVDAAIQLEDTQRADAIAEATVGPQVRGVLSKDIDTWARNAHTELRDRLAAAWSSRSWKKLKWYKLFWRVDDVGPVLGDVLAKAWLFDAERNMVWLNGRLYESNLAKGVPIPSTLDDSEKMLQLTPDEAEMYEKVPQFGSEARNVRVSDVIAPVLPPPFDDPLASKPLTELAYNPTTIASARRALAVITIPAIETLAQSMLLESLSTTALSSALSALLYVASAPATSVYEAGTIAALGTVWGLRRLQTRWEKVREEWIRDVAKEGRKVLDIAETEARRVVSEGGMGLRDDQAEMEEEIHEARKATEDVREMLKQLSKDA